MPDQRERRRFLQGTLVTGALALAGTRLACAKTQPSGDGEDSARAPQTSKPPEVTERPDAARPPEVAKPSSTLPPDEKKRLKEELQRELERKVYSVDQKLFRKINRARDPQHYQGHETSHVPKITAPNKVRRLEAFTVKIEVGVEEIHEMQVFHYIDWISLRLDGVQVSSTTVTPLFNRPIVTFELTLTESATLTAQEHCNLHGTWESEPLRVEV